MFGILAFELGIIQAGIAAIARPQRDMLEDYDSPEPDWIETYYKLDSDPTSDLHPVSFLHAV